MAEDTRPAITRQPCEGDGKQLCTFLAVPGEKYCAAHLIELAYGKKKRTHKYSAQARIIDGHRFPSKAEARHYEHLKIRERAGEIADLELQPKLALHTPKGTLLGHYIADFRYTVVASGEKETIDVKSRPTRTAIYRWKKRHAEDEHDIKVVEVKG